MQTIEKKRQGGLLMAMMWLTTVSTSLCAEKSGLQSLLTEGRIISHMGFDMDGLYDPFIFHALPYPGYLFYSPCYPFVTCAAFHQYRLIMKRKQRLQRLRERSERRASGRSFIGRQRAESYQMNENEILPGFRGYSQIRPEYKGIGDYLPEFSEKGTSAVGK
ncbi:hypothetical protein [Nitrosomonas sp. Nm132]|uniref:hypothetical protein n=1 Tax=Nitrosomonas sp. Nm132 TaxID=1881053 RepID=UPI00088319FC|nr:hypothetical protein [Nitrosomonas sp. Nm132]SDH37557.1 hypothetical protein SAMN05428952_10129 [Nitrosomonas sp. Nm132]